jgi:hypothetical protein
MKAETNIIRFYEGSYQYNVIEVLAPNTDTELFTGVLEELNHQYNYRPTSESLWADIVTSNKEKIFRITYKDKKTVTVWDLETDDRYSFSPLQEYSLVHLARH